MCVTICSATEPQSNRFAAVVLRQSIVEAIALRSNSHHTSKKCVDYLLICVSTRRHKKWKGSMPSNPQSMHRNLKQKLRYFLETEYRNRSEVREVLSQLAGLGRIAIIGGMLRDLSLFGNYRFKSDLDLVIDPVNAEKFRQFAKSIRANKNRYGGYSIPLKEWKIDVWVLQETWVLTNNHIGIDELEELPKATFFNCDAIVYDLSSRQLYCKIKYFENLCQRKLEINLENNPNPIGNSVRAFRYSIAKGFKWGPNLSEYVKARIAQYGWQKLEQYEADSFADSTLGQLDKEKLFDDLSKGITHSSGLFNACAYKLQSSEKQTRPNT